MAKEARIGELRTKIRVQALTAGMDAEGFQTETWTDLFDGKPVWCKWLNPHGTDIYEQLRLNLKEPATITMRYTPLINARCRVFKGYEPTGDEDKDDANAYEVISMDDVSERHRLLEIKVRRKVKA